MVQFKKFSLYKLFDKHVDRGTRLTRANRVLGDYPLATAGEQNTGVSDWIVENKQLFPANSITIDMFGNVFYRSYDYYADDNILVLHSDNWSKEVMLYISAQINHVLNGRFDYSRQFRQKVLRDVDIELPVTPAGEPDFEYMTMRIRELEAERIRELEAYLRVTGLDDTTLSASEAQALTQKVQWKKFKVGDVFNEAQLGDTNLKKSDLTLTGDFVVTSGQTNSGVLGRTTREAKIFSENTLTIDMFGYAYYRDFPYKMVTHGRVMSLSSDIIKNREVGLFLATVLSRLTNVFSYNNMATWKKLKNMSIMLPVTVNGNIDFEYMQNYIRATEKQTIKGVVEYKDRVIAETKKVVND